MPKAIRPHLRGVQLARDDENNKMPLSIEHALIDSIMHNNLLYVTEYVAGTYQSRAAIRKALGAFIWLKGWNGNRRLTAEFICEHLGMDYEILVREAENNWDRVCRERFRKLVQVGEIFHKQHRG